ncbi:MAG: PAS-domain containing protein [Paracoccaceae bacterium]
MLATLVLAAVYALASVGSALLVLLVLTLVHRRAAARHQARAAALVEAEPTIFLFDHRDLVDATAPARALLSLLPGPGEEWHRLATYLGPRIPGFDRIEAEAERAGSVALSGGEDGSLSLVAEHLGDRLRLTLVDLKAEGQFVMMDSLSQHAQEEELSALRDMLASLPIPAWRRGSDGTVAWSNSTYLALAANAASEPDLVWPLPDLFPHEPGAGPGRQSRRQNIRDRSGQEHWYDCQHIPSGDGSLGFAIPADAVVRAERSLRDFIQTLTKTFADLPIGLAIFDRNRQLALFNPALIDLTTLDGEFLIGRPTLFAFLDRLRDVRLLPEPKNYALWRQEMVDLEQAASSGQYQETWTLPSGQTYRITGRPHPEGAVAFLFEDISAEISLTRRFRAEIELAQSVVDALDDAVVVFAQSGDLIMSNRAYADLWGVDPRPTLGIMTIADATRHWQDRCLPTGLWTDIRDFVRNHEDRAEWEGAVTLAGGRQLDCTVQPLPRGATLVRFALHRAERLQVHRSRRGRVGADATGTFDA